MNAGEIEGTSERSMLHNNVAEYASRHIIKMKQDSRWSLNGDGGGDRTPREPIKMPTPFNRERQDLEAALDMYVNPGEEDE